MFVLAGEIIGVLAHVEPAEENAAGGAHAPDERRIVGGGRVVAIDLRAGAGDDALDIEQVLDRIRHAGERRRLVLRSYSLVDCVGLGQRAVERCGR